MFSPVQMLIIGAIAVLIFGERLPEVAKSMGKGLMEFKKSLQGLQNEITSAVNSSTEEGSSGLGHSEPVVEEYEETTAPKFELPPGPAASTAVAPEASPAPPAVDPAHPESSPV
jgi:sec-independent protein translocase protein TatA